MAARIALALLALVAGACRTPPSAAAETARAWSQGPAKWLLLDDEEASLRAVRTNADFAHFLAAFWNRRDDDPTTSDNPVARLFAERVQAADRLYGERHLRGCLTDRGRALLLLGPPHFLRYTEKRSPALEGTAPSGGRATRMVRVEVWGYLPADLPPPLRQQLAGEDDANKELAVTFLVGGSRARLLEGEGLLARAARALAHAGS